MNIGPERELIIGEAVQPMDPRNKRIADANDRPVGRLYANRYCSTRQCFEPPGPIPEE